MDWNSRLGRIGIQLDLSRRIRRLPRLPAGSRRTVVATTLIALSLVAGIYAQGSAERNALARWKKENPPRTSVWKHALGSRGWREVDSKSKDYNRIYRSLPTVIEEAGQAWFLGTAPCLAIFGVTEQVNPVSIHCRPDSSGELPKLHARGEAWQPLGQGWPAFEVAMERVDRLPKPATLRRKTQSEYSDPRALNY